MFYENFKVISKLAYEELLAEQKLSKIDFHNAFIEKLILYGTVYGLEGIKEYSVRTNDYYRQHGRIDIVYFNNGKLKLAIEIDSSAKAYSIVKLLNMPCEKIWIYYGRNPEKAIRTLKYFDNTNAIQYIFL